MWCLDAIIIYYSNIPMYTANQCHVEMTLLTVNTSHPPHGQNKDIGRICSFASVISERCATFWFGIIYLDKLTKCLREGLWLVQVLWNPVRQGRDRRVQGVAMVQQQDGGIVLPVWVPQSITVTEGKWVGRHMVIIHPQQDTVSKTGKFFETRVF